MVLKQTEFERKTEIIQNIESIFIKMKRKFEKNIEEAKEKIFKQIEEAEGKDSQLSLQKQRRCSMF